MTMRKFFLGLVLGIVMPPAILAVLALAGRLSINAKDEPPHWEKQFMQAVVARSVARQAPVLKNPYAATDDNLLAGMKVFHDDCDRCHGTGEKRSSWGINDFYPRVPQFGFDPPRLADWQIYWVVKNGIRYSGMGGNDPGISEEHAWKVALFLSRLDSLPPAVTAEWHKKQQ
jgi:mono/diheme cytochrome c family protein